MKIWNKIVIEPDGTVNKEESSWEQYEGPLALAMGDDEQEVPGISPEERALRSKQTEVLDLQSKQLQRQQKFQTDLQPFLFEEMGIEEILDPETGERSFQRKADPARDLREDLEVKQLQRVRDAFEGNLPVSPGLERGLASTERNVRERLRKQLGRNFEASTSGTEVLGDLFTRSEELREASRRGEMTQGAQTALSFGGFNQSTLGSFLGGAQGIAQGGLPFIQSGLGVSQGFNDPLSIMGQDRLMQMQVEKGNLDRSAASRDALIGAAGGIGGALATGGFSLAASNTISAALERAGKPQAIPGQASILRQPWDIHGTAG